MTHEEHTRQWYAEACGVARRLERNADITPCAHCKQTKEVHFRNGTGRCSCSTLSRHYLAVNQDEVDLTKNIILALENLAHTCGWVLG